MIAILPWINQDNFNALIFCVIDGILCPSSFAVENSNEFYRMINHPYISFLVAIHAKKGAHTLN